MNGLQLLCLFLLRAHSFACSFQSVSLDSGSSSSSAMGRAPPCEKGSCQWLENRAMRTAPMCAVCQHRLNVGYKKLQKDKAPKDGICLLLHPHLKQPQVDESVTSNGGTDSNNVNVLGTPPPRRPVRRRRIDTPGNACIGA
jgi:hypothetical protein